jgi:hypothetical protein
MNQEEWDIYWSNSWQKYLRNRDLGHLYPVIRPYLKGKIADLGCGVTNLYKPEHNITGVDISNECIRRMKERSPWGTWLVGDACNSGLPDAEFDTVVSSHVLEHYYDQAPLIKELKRICKPDGNIIAVVPRSCKDPDHVHVKWHGAKVEDRIASMLRDAKYELRARNHWIVRGKPTATASIVTIAWSPHSHRMSIMKKSLKTLRQFTKYPHKWVVIDNGPAEQTEFIKTLEPDIHIINRVNQGPPVSRNMGAGATDSDFIAFVDNDIEFYDGWLTDHINLLQKYPQRKWIAALSDSVRMRKPEHKLEEIDGRWYTSERGSSTCWVMSRLTFDRLGRWNIRSTVEDYDYSIRCQGAGYAFIYNIDGPRVRHMAVHRPTFRYKNKLVDGKWVKR